MGLWGVEGMSVFFMVLRTCAYLILYRISPPSRASALPSTAHLCHLTVLSSTIGVRDIQSSFHSANWRCTLRSSLGHCRVLRPQPGF